MTRLGGPTRLEVQESAGGPEPFERGHPAGDPEPAVDRTEALRERLFGNALGRWSSTLFFLVNDSGCIGHSQKACGHLVAAGRAHWNHRTIRAGVA
jgi:hypothetical protein